MEQKEKTPEQLQKRADYLRGKVATAQKELDAISARTATGPNVLIAVPCYSGQIEHKCVLSLMILAKRLQSAGIRHEIQFLPGVSLITQARNYFANRVAFDGDQRGVDFTHLFFVDSDNSGFADHFLEMLNADKPIVALPCAFKFIHWENVSNAAKRNIHPEFLREFCGEPTVMPIGDKVSFNEPVRVKRVGTALMLIKRGVFRALAEAHPEWRFKDQPIHFHDLPVPKRDFQFNFFQVGIDPKTLEYLSEDHFLCEAAGELGFRELDTTERPNNTYRQLRLCPEFTSDLHSAGVGVSEVVGPGAVQITSSYAP